MPTPATEARNRVTGIIKQQADMIESTIEEHIAQGATKITLLDYQGHSGAPTLGLGFLPHGVTWPALQEVKRRYEDAGWVVKLNSDQRDGISLVVDAGEPA